MYVVFLFLLFLYMNQETEKPYIMMLKKFMLHLLTIAMRPSPCANRNALLQHKLCRLRISRISTHKNGKLARF
jgi:hypothetical protein